MIETITAATPAAAQALAVETTKVPGADITVEWWAWVAFIAFIAGLLVLDLKVFHRHAHEVSLREAAWFSAFWIALGLLFGVLVLFWLGSAAFSQYLTGYVIEKSLSIDNVFVWAVVFSFFAVPPKYQHETLFWGIFGALVLRAIFILVGVALLEAFSWIVFVFGALLLFTSYRIATHDDEQVHPERNPLLRFVRRFVPMTADYRDDHFFVKERGRRYATPLFAALVVIEATDVVFAVDSIPAILAVTRSDFLVWTSNAFAILGLRALYFLLAGIRDRFIYLNIGLAVILAFVGVKMIISPWYHLPTFISLGIIAFVLTVTIGVSLVVSGRRRREREAAGETGPIDAKRLDEGESAD